MNLKFIELIDIEKINNLLEGFNKTTGFVTAIIDLEGNIISKSGWRNICTDFHRLNPETTKKCTISDTELANKMAEGEKYNSYTCLNGLVDVAVPLIINGEHIANLFSGQFFFEKPDRNFFKKQAAKYGFDEKKYLEALDKVPVASKEKVQLAMDFLLNMTQLISEIALQNQEKTQLHNELEQKEDRLSKILLASNDGMWDWDLETNTVYFDPRYYHLSGYDVDEFPHVLAEFQKRIYPDDVDYVMNEAEKHLKGEIDRFDVKFRFMKKSGDWQWIQGKGIIVERNEEGVPLRFVGTHRDISDLKQAEEKLKSNYGLLRIAGETSRFGGWNVDLEKYIAYWSDTVADIHEVPHGYAPPVQEGINFYAPEWREKITQVFTDCAEKGIPYDEEMEIITQKGKRVWVRTVGRAVKDEKGKIIKVQGSFQDITDRKQSEEKLNESKKILELVMNSIPQFIFWKDCNSIYLGCNENFAHAAGLKTANEIAGKTDYDLSWEKDEADFYIECDRRVINSGIAEYHIIESQFQADGKRAWLDTNKVPVFDETGLVVGILGTYEDITERKQAEIALAESEENLSITLQSIGDGVISTDINGLVVNMNPVAEKLCGWKLSDALGKPLPEVFKIVNAETRDTVADPVAKVLENGDIIGLANHTVLISKDGSEYQIADSAAPIKNKEGKISGVVLVFSDVTEKYAKEKKIKESEETFRNIVQASPMGIHLYQLQEDNALVFTGANLAADKLLGIDNKQFIGKTIEKAFPPLQSTEVPDRYRRAASNGEHWHTEQIDYDHDGIKSAFEVHAFQMTLGKVGVLFSAITERKKAEKALQESELQNRTILQTALNGFWVVEKDGRFTEVNNAYCELTGYTREELLTMSVTDVEVLESEAEVSMRIQRLLQSGSDRFKTKHRCKNGRIVDVEINIHLLKDNEKFFVFISDITERKAMEESLNQQSLLRKLLMEISSDFINIPFHQVDEAVSEALQKMAKFVTADRAYTFNYNWEKDVCDNIYEWCAEGISPEIDNLQDVPLSMMQDWVEAHRKGKSMYVPDVFSLPRGAVREILEPQGIISVLTVPMMNGDHCIGFVGFDSVRNHHHYTDTELQLLKLFAQLLTNVTLRKQIVDQLVVAKEKAEESDRLKSAFLANMSHEIRTPMNGILGFSELLKDPNLTGDEQQEYIQLIGKSGKRMLNIINDIVDISKIEAGLMKLNIKKTNINEQIEYIYTFFKPEVEAKGMKISFSTTLPTSEATIESDREKLYAILTNLVKNAIKYSEKGSIEFGYIKRADFLEFYVKDTGVGISKDRQEAIFERFIQADIADSMARQGAGLGLSITKAYIEMLGGRIWVESEEGIGSTFYFTLPYNAELIKETYIHQTDISDKKESIKKLKILIAEDDELSLQFLSILIKDFAGEVLKVRTGIKAVEAFKRATDIDLVLMDIQLPGINGYEATHRIREFNKEVIIIAQTAYAISGDREKAIEAGCNDYISKPIDKDKLQALIQKYFGK